MVFLLVAGFRVLRLASVSTYIWSISEGSARISTSTWEKPFEMTAPRSVSTSVSCFVPQEIYIEEREMIGPINSSKFL